MGGLVIWLPERNLRTKRAGLKRAPTVTWLCEHTFNQTTITTLRFIAPMALAPPHNTVIPLPNNNAGVPLPPAPRNPPTANDVFAAQRYSRQLLDSYGYKNLGFFVLDLFF